MAGVRKVCLHSGRCGADAVLTRSGFLTRCGGDGACGRGGCGQRAELRAGAGGRGDGSVGGGFGESGVGTEGGEEVGKERPVGGHIDQGLRDQDS